MPRDQYPDVEHLIADARLKLQFEGVEQPTALPAPRRPLLLPVFAVVALLFVGASVYGFTRLNSAPPTNAVAQIVATPTTLPPTATATIQPTVAPTTEPTPVATAEVALPATVVVTTAANDILVKTPKNIEIIVDASGNMLAQIPGTDKQRWQVAQDALRALIGSGTITEQSYVAVRTYGRQRSNDCGDLELAQPPGTFNVEQRNTVIDQIKPAVGGMTPLGASLQAAATDLQAAEGSTAVILVTDGLESCNGDPVAEAATFVRDQPQRNVHVIGFALDNQQASEALQQIAVNGNGRYFDAANSTQLAEALRQTIVLSYSIFAADGSVAATGTLGQPADMQLLPGTYKLQVSSSPPLEKTFTVESGQRVEIQVRQGFGGLAADVQSSSP